MSTAQHQHRDPEFLARRLLQLDAEIKALREQKEALEQELATNMPDRRIEVAGLGAFERNRKKDRKQWDNDSLFHHLAVVARNDRKADETTGEVEAPEEALLRTVMECARPDWRVTALRSRGIDADEYCQTTFTGGWSIRFYGKADQ